MYQRRDRAHLHTLSETTMDKPTSIADWTGMRARVTGMMARGECDHADGCEQLANIDAHLARLRTPAPTAARPSRVVYLNRASKSKAHAQEQAELAANAQRHSEAAYRRIGKKPPALATADFGFLMGMAGVAAERRGPLGVPVPGLSAYYAERRADALRTCAESRRLFRGAGA
jgi:hypothetical protein